MVEGEVTGFHSVDPEYEPLKVWTGMSAMPTLAVPQMVIDDIVADEMVEMIEKLPNNVARRTYWRLR